MLVSHQVKAMGTTIDYLFDDSFPDDLTHLVEERLVEYESRFSANDTNSELMQVNTNAGKKIVSVNPGLFKLIQLGKKHSLSSESHLNITIGPLVQTWRIGFDDARVPDDREIRQKLSLIDPNCIVLDESNYSVYLAKEGMKLDLGALAKGYIADLIVSELQKNGVQSGLINLGGNVLTFGHSNHVDGLWRVGIRDPNSENNDCKFILKVINKSIVTSGIYERTLTTREGQYHHIFDSKTGYPVETDVASVTVISERSIDGEIWTTRLFGYPAPEIISQTNQHPGIESLVLLDDGTAFFSEGMYNFL